MKAFDFFS
jgi:hypothetical protein